MTRLSTLAALMLALLVHGDALAQDEGSSVRSPPSIVIELRLVEAPLGSLRDVPRGPPFAARVRDGGWGLDVRSLLPSLDLRLPLRVAQDEMRVLSAPRLRTPNHRPVYIQQPTTLSYREAGSQGHLDRQLATSLNIEVTPHLRPGGALSLGVVLTRDEPGPIRRRAEVRARVEPGTTIAISGLEASAPIGPSASAGSDVHAIPILGPLMPGAEPAPDRQLFVFITPRVVSRPE